MSSLHHLSLSELRAGLDAKQFSSLELCKHYLSRIDQNKNLNAFITIEPDKVIAQAEEADRKIKAGERADLLGVPVAVKDLILTKGTRTTCASKMLDKFIAPYDATVVRKMREVGAVILGKTNLDEFAMGSSNENSFFGPVKNPWDSQRVPGGSSGGSAAALAAGLCPVALGTDTGGSIRQPASFCSVVGLKPTYGRVSRYGVVAYASSFDQVGPMANSVRDCGVLARVISGHDACDSTSTTQGVPAFGKDSETGIKGLRIGIPKEYFIKGLNPEIEQSVNNAIKTLESLGAEVIEISLPHTELALAVYYVLVTAEASSNLARFDGIRYGHRAEGAKDLRELYAKSRQEGFGREVKRRIMLGTHVLSTGYYDAYYLQAQKVRSLIAKDFTDAFELKCDVIACPAAPSTAFKLGEKTSNPLEMYLSDIFTIPVNLAGLPGMCVPCGFDKSGLPIGLQLIGRLWDEQALFQVASAFESATDWHTKKSEIYG